MEPEDAAGGGRGPRSPASPVEHWPLSSDLDTEPPLAVSPDDSGWWTPAPCAWCGDTDHMTMNCPTPVCLTCNGPHWASKCTNGACDTCGSTHDTAFCPLPLKQCGKCLGCGHQAEICERPWNCRNCRGDGHLESTCPKDGTARRRYCPGCKAWGDHTAWECQQPPECWKCHLHGHWQTECPMEGDVRPPPPLASGPARASSCNGLSLLSLVGGMVGLGQLPRPWGGGGMEAHDGHVRGSKRGRSDPAAVEE